MQKLYVIKIGGNIIDNPVALAAFLKDFSEINEAKILVHGGGKIATQLADTMGIETKMVDGRRITDQQTIDLVTMVYGGLINKNIVAQLQALGCKSLGLCGADGQLILAEKRPVNDIDYGFVGDIKKVDATGIAALIAGNFNLIIAPLTADTTGQILNTNADTMAAEIAKALVQKYEVQLFYCFEKPGVLANAEDDNSYIPKIDTALYEALKADGTINKGMLPKMENAMNAAKSRVKKVYICHAKNLKNIFGENPIATLISQ
jgi:acetylglutamate kinase